MPLILFIVSLFFTPHRVYAATNTVKTSQELLTTLSTAKPGDTIVISGTLQGGIIIRGVKGSKAAPITITGGIIAGGGKSRLVQLNDLEWVIFDHITFDAAGSDSAIYMLHSSNNAFTNNILKNAGGECFKIKIASQHNSITGNTITSCGRTNWQVPTHKNGEGIYVGTAPEQLSRNVTDGYTSVPDETNYNYIANNTLSPGGPDFQQGNECVDIKEAASYNLIENNTCSGQIDKNSGGMESRGDYTMFRNNTFTPVICGAGIRLGGDNKSTQGVGNLIIQNIFHDYSSTNIICPPTAATVSDKTAIHGAVKVEAPNQGYMCGNTVKDTVIADGTFKSQVVPSEFIGPCDQTKIDAFLSGKSFGFLRTSTPTPTPTPQVTYACHGSTLGTLECFTLWKDTLVSTVFDVTADFYSDGMINLKDFELWRRSSVI